MKNKKRKRKTVIDILKKARKQSRGAEIKAHGKILNRTKIEKSKKIYDRKKQKRAIDES